jgi:diaminohydroxyphosphoribosylaminopyrimidine deaminase/5-amino-6-(5-phosphoribosylamino)uracil reductase
LTARDAHWLDAAVALARPMLGTTADNPTVGAIVVDPGTERILGQGITAPGGRPHAEPIALAMAGSQALGATLYVTLEPCHHHGRTPPCVDAVLAAGVARVVIGIIDPDPRTAGESVERLRAAGVEVLVADHTPSRRLHEGFVMRVTAGRPFITLKLAVSADGMIGRPDQGNVPITGDAARHWTHLQRAASDAIMVGGRTALIDDPKLTVRIPELPGRKPLRVILAGSEALGEQLNLIAQTSVYPTAIIAVSGTITKVPSSIALIETPGLGARPDLAAAMRALGARGIQNLLVEPGARLTEALLAADLADRFALLTSSAIVGPDGLPAAAHGSIQERIAAAGLVEVDRQPLGGDMVTVYERGATARQRSSSK